MAFFVAIHQQAPPDRIEQVLAAIRGDLATARRLQPGRRRTRVFHHVSLSEILTIGEWESQAEYERLLHSPLYQELTVRADPPARIDYPQRLTSIERLSLRPMIAASAVVTAPEATREQVAQHLITSVRPEILAEPGLVTHELYQAVDDSCRLWALHTWVSVDALNQYRRRMSVRHELELLGMGATMERLVGSIAAVFSHKD
jgi:quinol monooxygenase YgiN